MEEIALARINSFAHVAEQIDVPPEEKSIFVLSSSQLQEIISNAVQNALEGHETLPEIAQAQAREIEALKSILRAMQKDLDSLAENDLNQLRLINDLRHKSPGKMEISRAEKIAKYLEARPDHKASFETLKGYLGADKDLLKRAIKTLMASSPGRYGIVRASGDKRKRTLVMLSK